MARIGAVTGSVTSDFGARLHRVAIDFMLAKVGGPRIDQAVAVAEDLVASGFSGDATIEVAALLETLRVVRPSRSSSPCWRSMGSTCSRPSTAKRGTNYS